MQVQILEVKSGKEIAATLEGANSKYVPLKKNGWNFNWKDLMKTEGSSFYKVSKIDTPDEIEGIIMLSLYYEEMIYLNNLELAPHNIGKGKEYDWIAGILLAYGCQYSIEYGKGEYKGYLTFDSKTALIPLYQNKYGAIRTGGQKMFIDPIQGEKLISTYLSKSSS